MGIVKTLQCLDSRTTLSIQDIDISGCIESDSSVPVELSSEEHCF